MTTTEKLTQLAALCRQLEPESYNLRARAFFAAVCATLPVAEGNELAAAMGFDHLKVEAPSE